MFENIYNLLSAEPDVTTEVDNRIYFNIAKQGTKTPYIVWQPISNVAYNTLSCEPDADQQRIQIDIYGSNPITIVPLTVKVRSTLQKIGNCIAGPVPVDFETESGLYRYTMDFSIYHARAA